MDGDNLIERRPVLERLERHVEALAGRRGAVVTVRGGAGLGKSALLDHARATAEAAGTTVRRFRSTPAERSMVWAGARELLGAGWEPARGSADSVSLAHATRHLDILAGDRPLLLAVDDAQWLDHPTLRWLHFLGRRLEERPVAVLVSCRPGFPGGDLTELLALGDTIDLAPLSAAGVTELVRGRLGGPGPDFVSRCLELTGGNPFLVGALVDTLAARALPPVRGTLDELGDEPPTRVVDMVRLRLARLPEVVVSVAGAAAVAGRHSTIHRLCQLTCRSADEVTGAVEELQGAGLVGTAETPAFVHPLEATAALRELSPTRAEQLHRRMAELLHAEGAEDVEVARHLEHCGPLGTPWAAPVLRRAGQRSADVGDHHSAVRWLRRAVEEPVDRERRADLLGALAHSELALGLPAGVGRLRAICDESRDPGDRLRLARVLAVHGRVREAASELDGLLATSEGATRDRALRQLLPTLRQSLDLRPRSRALLDALTAEVDSGEAGDPSLLAELAYEHALVGAGRDLVADLAGRALATAEHGKLHATAAHVLFLALVWAGELRSASTLVQMRDRAGDLDAVQHHRRGQLALSVGAIEQAQAHGLAALETARFDAPVIFPAAVAQVARSQLRLGELDDAGRLLEPLGRDPNLPDLATFHSVLLARGELALARCEWEEALAAAEACRGFSERMGTENPVVMPWHTVAAEALFALDRLDDARDVAADALGRIERFGYAPGELRRPLERVRRDATTEARRSMRAHPSRSVAVESRACAGPILRVLGTSRLETGDDDRVLGGGLSDRALRYLGVQRTSVHRDRLVEALWSDVDPTIGRARLRKVLSELRQRHGDVLDTTGDLVALAPEVTVDVREFRRLALEAVTATDDDTAVRAGAAALEWYGGELCELDRYEDWADDLRETVGQEWAAVSHRVAARCAAAGEYDRAMMIIEELIAARPWDDTNFLVGARWLAAAGRRSAARALLGRARATADELGVPASPEVEDLDAELSA